jgi:hypothetical protein
MCTVLLPAVTRGGAVFEALCYKPGGGGIDSRWCHWNLLLTVFPQLATSQKLQVHASHTKTASIVPPEDGRLTPETCIGSRHNKVIVKVKVY